MKQELYDAMMLHDIGNRYTDEFSESSLNYVKSTLSIVEQLGLLAEVCQEIKKQATEKYLRFTHENGEYRREKDSAWKDYRCALIHLLDSKTPMTLQEIFDEGTRYDQNFPGEGYGYLSKQELKRDLDYLVHVDMARIVQE